MGTSIRDRIANESATKPDAIALIPGKESPVHSNPLRSALKSALKRLAHPIGFAATINNRLGTARLAPHIKTDVRRISMGKIVFLLLSLLLLQRKWQYIINYSMAWGEGAGGAVGRLSRVAGCGLRRKAAQGGARRRKAAKILSC